MRHFNILAVAAAAAVVTACGPGEPAKDAPPAPPPPTDAEKAATLASLPAPYNAGNLENGQRKFALCRSCHTITPNGPNLTGPNLYGVFGRKAGGVEGYTYSEALKKAGFVWEASHLDAWLADPRGYMPGTKMTFLGIKEPQDRIDLIAYLKVETGYKPAAPAAAPAAEAPAQ
ncbi:cytochrome c family protein [Caulobacter segnis]|uniref:c-type cytochrome n=1 Tax=Caulobacter segnis TaxID=88688 RepID=UPI00240FFE16|nr:cytochrome c family protein [Caulobacter segnis]MDG2523557.1 cytochrome c family protein [Caulobacter segnis]